MKQTPIHDNYNPDILRSMPMGLKRVIEIGCSSGALAKAYKAINPACEYIGMEIDAEYAELSRTHWSKVLRWTYRTAGGQGISGVIPVRLLDFRRCSRASL